MECEAEYQSELNRIVFDQISQQTAGLRSSIAAKQEEIAVLDAHRPETKQDYLTQRDRLQTELEELIQQLRQSEGSVRELAAADPTNQWAAIRVVRGRLLAQCDWTQMPDAPLSDDLVTAWRGYRQALRDLPETYDDPKSVEFPVPPESAALPL